MSETLHPEIERAMNTTSWQVVGWHAFREAIKTRDALMLVQTFTPGLHRRINLREGPRDPRTDPDRYHHADLI